MALALSAAQREEGGRGRRRRQQSARLGSRCIARNSPVSRHFDADIFRFQSRLGFVARISGVASVTPGD